MPVTMQREMRFAAQLPRPAIPIVLRGLAVNGLLPGQPVSTLDPFNPVPAEQQMIEYLQSLNLAKSKHQTGVALVLLAVGLLALAKN